MQREDISEILEKALPGDLMGVVLDIEERYGLNAEQVREIAAAKGERRRVALEGLEEGE